MNFDDNRIPDDTKSILRAAVRILNTHSMKTEDVVSVIYYLGRSDGRMFQLDQHSPVIQDLEKLARLAGA
jgi:hypothetical protein